MRSRTALVLGLAAVALAAGLLVQAERSVFALVPLLDEVWYLDRAAELDGLAAPADEAHFMSPLYPVLVKLAGAGGGVPTDRVVPPAQLRGLRLLQLACWLAVAALLRVAAGRWLPSDAPARRWLLWLPAVLFLLYRPAAVYALAVLVELPLLLLVAAAVALLPAPGRGEAGVVRAILLGACLGLAGLLRGTALVLVPVAMLAVAAAGPRGRRRALLTAAAAALVLLPAVLHNSRASGRLVGPTLNAGVNLAVGNGPDANGLYVAVVPGDWREDPAGRAHLARREGRADLSLADADRRWAAWAWRHAAADPLRTAGLWLRKVWLHLQGWEIDQLTPLAGWRHTVPLLGLLVVPWALVVVLAAAGAADGLSARRPGAWLLPAMAGTLLVVQSAFFVVSRYRLTLLPVLAVLAATGAAALLRRRRTALVAAAVCALLVVPWGLGTVRAHWRAQALANEALRWADLGRARDDAAATARAETLYRRALDAGASGAAPWLGLAALLDARGAQDEAAAVLARGVLHEDGSLELRKVLVSRLLQLGRDDQAMARLHALLDRWPDDPDALHNMAILLAGRGRLPEAAAHAERLVAAAPDDPRGYNDLGILLARLGRREEAADVFRRGLAAVPGDPDLRANLARVAGP